MANKIKAIIESIAIIIGIITIFVIARDAELAVGFITLSFGLLAIIWTYKAVKSLSKGSTIRKHTFNFFFCLIFILLFSIWNTVESIAGWKIITNETVLYFEYLLITLSFLMFVYASYHIAKIGKEFGFETKAADIKKVIEKKK